MRRDRLDRVPSAQMIASPRQNPAPAVIAAHVDALAGAGLRHRGAVRPRPRRAKWRTSARVMVMPSSAIGSLINRRRAGFPVQGPAARKFDASAAGQIIHINSINWGNFRGAAAPALPCKIVLPLQERASGEMAEWLKAHAWKACVRETVPWVRIPLSPPNAKTLATPRIVMEARIRKRKSSRQ
jgi:hypothetical protein